jgi:alkanesulfonate monooxygenase SsuD/methylene tetrahydromethanopterin reductase-like flavin-dependent oxidoreductase (luciferase family)
VAKICDRAGIDVVWVADPGTSADEHPRLEAWMALTLAGLDTSRGRIGAMLDIALRPPATLAAMAGMLDVALGGRLEIGFAGGPEREHRPLAGEAPEWTPRAGRLEEYVRIVRTLLEAASPEPAGPPVSVEVTDSLGIGVAARVADDVVIPAMAVPDLPAMIEQVRAGCEASGRDPSSLGIAVELPVSIGRTSAEAQARASAESLFRTIGHPLKVGIFGTLEQCQDRVIELAHAGVTELRCILPNTVDVHDVIAQLTAMVMGTVDVLSPNAPRSPAPDPPEGWGGRSWRR